MDSSTILVVDDDPKIRLLLRRGFESDGLIVIEAATESDVMAALDQHDIDLVTLDIYLGQDNGLEIAKRLRQKSAVPIIMVTGKDDVIDRVVGLEIGADDYITKPFHIREVLARVRAILRRAQAKKPIKHPKDSSSVDEQSLALAFDGMVARFEHFELLGRSGEIVELTSGEFRLLSVFLQNPKRVLSRDRLMDLLGGADWSPLDRTIDNQIARLRRKIERDPTTPKLIKTVRGIGYVFATDVQTW
jgi:DNA-binding response OmpR family regulator